MTEAIPGRSVLVLGGARSGKSAFAQSLAESTAPERLYIAAGSAGDDEMAARIARHRAERGASWTTLEEPVALSEALVASARKDRVVLVDCLTLWLTNVMLGGGDCDAATAKLCATIATLDGPAILVSNEVGSGIVPESALGRRFRDAQGRLNAAMARACDVAVLVVAGRPVLLKPARALNIALS